MNITIGADPEVFVSDRGTIVPVVGLLGGTKKEPLPVVGGAVQEDNVLAEFNINPARTSDEFVSGLTSVMGQLREKLSPMDITVRTSHVFQKQELLRSGRQALMFGCDPDYNAYTRDRNVAPSARTGLRTAGGHIHVGYDSPTEDQNITIIKRMDVFLGLPSLLLDDDEYRRKMYGAAGCYRNKPYGVEYRTLSNFWLSHTDLMKWAFNNTQLAFESDLTPSEVVEQVINTGDKKAAELYIRDYGVPMP